MTNQIKSYKLIATSLLALMLTTVSCTKVIEIELKDADRQYVIEGAVYEGVDSAMVRVSRTTSYFDSSQPEVITDAVVKLTMPDNSIITMSHIGNGIYKASGLTVPTESTYQLQVDVAGKMFTASSYMKPSMPLDTLEYEFQEGIFGGDDGYNVFLVFQDEIGKDFYRIQSTVNGVLLNKPEDLLVIDDNLNDGNLIRIPVFTHLYEAGDTVIAELNSLDSDLYEFYQTFGEAAAEDAGSPFNAAPSNPETNIKGGALGVFGAFTISKRTIILPQ